MEKHRKNRLTLVAIVLVFAAPLIAALLLNMSGWRPSQTRNYGVLLQPPQDVSAVPLALATGGTLDWRDPQWHWTLLAVPGSTCAQDCQSRLAELVRLRITLNRNAERLRLVYVGNALPGDAAQEQAPLIAARDEHAALAAYRPLADDALALALVNPNGLLILRYAPGYDAARLRQDIVKVVH